jgi:hypothetical protein
MFLLIHGYGIGITSPFHTPKPLSNVGFAALESLIDKAQGTAFCWRNDYQLKITEAINPLTYFDIYREERKKSVTDDVQTALRQHLLTHKPRVIVTHSLGAHVLFVQLNRFGLPDSVEHIWTIQADVDSTTEITHPSVTERLQNKTLTWTNHYFPWDQALVASSIHHGAVRAGLIGFRQKHITNKLFYSWKSVNLHQGSIEDPRLADLLGSIIST